jgi:hypothetical protein
MGRGHVTAGLYRQTRYGSRFHVYDIKQPILLVNVGEPERGKVVRVASRGVWCVGDCRICINFSRLLCDMRWHRYLYPGFYNNGKRVSNRKEKILRNVR